MRERIRRWLRRLVEKYLHETYYRLITDGRIEFEETHGLGYTRVTITYDKPVHPVMYEWAVKNWADASDYPKRYILGGVMETNPLERFDIKFGVDEE